MALFDFLKRRVQTSSLRREVAAPNITGSRTIWTDSVASGLTPVRLAQALQAAVEGDHDPFLTLAEELEELDPHYGSVLGTRKRAVSGIKPIVQPASESPRDVEIATAVAQMIARPRIKRGITDLLDALGKGYAVGEIMWETGATWEPVELKWRDPRFFVFDQVAREEIRLRDELNLSLGIPLAPFKFVQHVPQLKSGIPIRGGLARLVSWCYLFKAYTIKDWVGFLEVFGLPLRLGKYDEAQDSPDDIEVLKRAVLSLGTNSAGVIPKSMEIEFVQLSNLSGAQSLFERSADWFDSQISKAVLGQTMTADNGSSLSQAEVHNQVRHDIQMADADELEITLQRDLIRPYVELNYGPQETYPIISYPVTQPEDVESLARSLSLLIPVGLTVKATQVRDKLGLDAPQAGDELLTMGAAADAQTGLNDQHAGCPGCGAPSLALNAAGDDIEADIDEIEAPFLDDWEAQLDPLIGPLRSLLEQSNSYEAFSAGLADLLTQYDDADHQLITSLAISGFMAQGLGNGGPQ